MKKILLTLGSTLVAAAPIATVVSCDKDDYEYVFGTATLVGTHLTIEGFEQPSADNESVHTEWFEHMGTMLDRPDDTITKVTLRGKISNALGLADFESTIDFEYMYLFDDLKSFIYIVDQEVVEVPLTPNAKVIWAIFAGFYDSVEDDGAEAILSQSIKGFVELTYLETSIPKGGFVDFVATTEDEITGTLGLNNDAFLLIEYLMLYGAKFISYETKAGVDEIVMTFDFSSGNKYTATITSNLSMDGQATPSETKVAQELDAEFKSLTLVSTKNSTDDLSSLTATTEEEATTNFGITASAFTYIMEKEPSYWDIDSIGQNPGEPGTLLVNYTHTDSARQYKTVIPQANITWADTP